MKAPRLPSFIKINKHKRFELSPRYYSERKERLRRLQEKYEKIDGDVSIRREFKERWSRNRKLTKSSSSYATVRLVVIMIVLFALAYWVFGMDLEKLLNR